MNKQNAVQFNFKLIKFSFDMVYSNLVKGRYPINNNIYKISLFYEIMLLFKKNKTFRLSSLALHVCLFITLYLNIYVFKPLIFLNFGAV